MRVTITGSTGMVGSALAESLAAAGHTVLRLVRPESSASGGGAGTAVRWVPAKGVPMDLDDRAALEGLDAVVHLAGANIAAGRWSDARKRVLHSSRVDTARHLIAELAKLASKPKVFLSASAVGYYGNRGEEILTEESAPGNDFLAQLAQDWERAAAGAEDFGARVVMLRFGVILWPKGGALAKMLLPFKLGAGGRLGSGRQWWPWVTLPDVLAVIRYAIENPGLRGPVNGSVIRAHGDVRQALTDRLTGD